MQDTVSPEEGKTVEEAVHELHNGLGVPRWRVTPEQDESAAPDRDPRAPLWWDDDEEASASFLHAMGIGA